LHHYAADLIELLDHLQVQRAHVIGMSFGGMIAQWLAIEHPSRVGRLVLVSTAHQLTPYLGELAQLLGHAVYLLPRQLFERLLTLLTTSPLALRPDAANTDSRMKDEVAASEIVRQLRCITRSIPTDNDYRIQAQTLVLAGEFDALIPSCFGRTMASMIPDSRFLLIHGAGHNVLRDAPLQTADVIRQFLESGMAMQPGELDRTQTIPISA
jgi:3-oxoadipate enol-lactonase